MFNLIKQAVPMPVRLAYRRIRQRVALIGNDRKSPRDVFGEIYTSTAWGRGLNIAPGTLYSGPGSNEELAIPYAAEILRYAKAHRLTRIVDLGCGDFRVGRFLAVDGISYFGVDVVPAVVENNRRLHERDGIQFACLDITTDPLPVGDLCLVREVFQHLSNRQIAAALRQMRQYPHVIVSENQFGAPGALPVNVDRPHGAVSRSGLGTILDLSAPPFSVACSLLFEIPIPRAKKANSVVRGFNFRN